MFPRVPWSGAVFAAWLLLATAGMAVLWTYQAQPGQAARAPSSWPAESALAIDSGKQAMLVWIHPRCPCTRATISELERLLVHVTPDVDCQVIISQPRQADWSFHDTDLTASVRRLPNVKIVIDADQMEAKRFGVSTSGQVLMYGRDGELVFAGGITAGRGHEGGNHGTTALRELFDEPSMPSCCRDNPVFGCQLFSESREGKSP